jgi:hypothetical protein
MKHSITHDDGRNEDGEYRLGRDPRNHICICTSCGYRYAGTSNAVARRGAEHVEIFNRNAEPREWSNPGRRTNMPFHTW